MEVKLYTIEEVSEYLNIPKSTICKPFAITDFVKAVEKRLGLDSNPI